MKYKSRNSSSKYISYADKAQQRAKIKRRHIKTRVIFLIFFVAVPFFVSRPSLAGYPVIRSIYERAAKAIDIGNSRVFEKASDYVSAFCIGYLRGETEKKTNAYARENDTPKKEKSIPSDARGNDKKTASDGDGTALDAQTPQSFLPALPCVGEVTSDFGERKHPVNGEDSFHNGIDIALCEGSQIHAAESGTVEKSEYNEFSGNYVVISHRDGYTTSYAHMSRVGTKAGDIVKKGDVIGYAGSTGIATGPHLHFEVRKDGKVLNPNEFIK